MKKIYIALDSFNFGVATVISMTEDAELLFYISSPCFANGSIPAFIELSNEKEYLQKYNEVYGDDYELVLIKDFNYPKEYLEIVKKYKA
jgi:dTDP-4-dehydrorhamnose 3,5-epimerase-like enzyme